MSYPFDATQLQVQKAIKLDRPASGGRLLARRAARQARRAQRAI